MLKLLERLNLKPQHLALALVVLTALGGLTVAIEVDDQGVKRVAISVDRASGDLEPEPAIEPGRPETLRDETPDEIPADTLDRAQRINELVVEDLLLEPQPIGGAQNYSCRPDFKGRVWSSRNGQRPTEFVLHYTVSANRAGWSDVYAIRDYFARTRVGSAHYIIDFEGHCLKTVPLDGKAWTQGAANPTSISVEIVATGAESRAEWLESRLIQARVLSSLARDVMRLRGIPLRFVNPRGCVFPPGWTDHNALECGNNHHDVTPAFPYAEFQRQLVDGPVTATDRRTCRKLNWWRRNGRPNGEPERRAVRRREALEARGVRCTSRGPVRVG